MNAISAWDRHRWRTYAHQLISGGYNDALLTSAGFGSHLPRLGLTWNRDLAMDFDITPYSGIRNALMPYGIKCGINSRHQITVSTQDGPIWPDAGNSFWITCATGQWHLFTWNSIGYLIPEDTNLVEICRTCMQIESKAMYVVPKSIVEQFGLIRLEHAEVKRVFAAMKTAK